MWEAPKFTCDNEDLETSLTMLQSAGVKGIKQDLQIVSDEQGIFYFIPIFAISDPSSYIEVKKIKEFEVKEVQL